MEEAADYSAVIVIGQSLHTGYPRHSILQLHHAKLISGLGALSLTALAQARPKATATLQERTLYSSDIWCGPVLNASATEASAQWTVPTVSLLPRESLDPKNPPMFYQWVGIDGDVWYEFYTPKNNASWHQTEPAVGPGDNVSVTVTADKDGKGGTIYIQNLSNNTGKSYYAKVVEGQLCFQHVEWVTEAPTMNQPGFDNFTFNSISAKARDGTTINATGSDLWYLNESSGKCSAPLSDDGTTAYLTNAAPRWS
ncbi:Concanavalin A-like lectin/glucanase [Cordyceps fumosorosea ARSEF 2679]|uniref:Concanavalin A-like lectin/glucanase n=1 Tax=Cordyceps fumosorosea (strain ARSEF 2679) TaxID=1081104 RepID=A0A167NZ92_CORFA|nr:Concanavalin A-like lectin/glucanase [Cordyceps fumosorosea ARSEF 2679]OAA56108.1 Concanavalin A-like lectin/glucanase [Cordyceps fumosorosea ARSEF 2679]